MCGIGGIWNAPGASNIDGQLGAMLRAMNHRGPDGSGRLRYSGGAAGMVRLALVDLSPLGAQPMWSPNHDVAIIYNGETYNFREHREQLLAEGYPFKSHTDTEVVLALYIKYGEQFLTRLRGMYALGIFDFRHALNGSPTLLLARDPLGIKPLYIAEPQGSRGPIYFASELRALVQGKCVEKEIDRHALNDFLTYGFVAQPRTILKNVRMLQPGTMELFSVGQEPQKQIYWKLPKYAPVQETMDESAERLRALLENSIRCHALADARVGAFLSGGMDSAAVVGLMRKYVTQLKTYTLRFPDLPNRDEVSHAKATARFFDVENETVDISGQDVVKCISKFAGDLDQPSTDGFNTWLISRGAAQDLKAVVSGLGADEWFAGYPVARRMQRFGSGKFAFAQRSLAFLSRAAADMFALESGPPHLRAFAARRTPLSLWCYAHSVCLASTAERLTGVSHSENSMMEYAYQVVKELAPEWRSEPIVNFASLLDVGIYLRSQLLRDSDVTSMAHSIELRTPFVDTEIAAFARTCTASLRLSPTASVSQDAPSTDAKRVLFHAVAQTVPAAVTRLPKRGFSLPQDIWLTRDLNGILNDTCSEESVVRRGLMDPEIYKKVRDGALMHRYAGSNSRLWALMIFELWAREFLDTEIDHSLD